MNAELVALELATGALLKLSRGYRDVVPHKTDFILNELECHDSYHHLRSILYEIGVHIENAVRELAPPSFLLSTSHCSKP